MKPIITDKKKDIKAIYFSKNYIYTYFASNGCIIHGKHNK